MIHSPLGAYLPGSSPLHRLPAGAKLLGLFVFATAAVALRSVPSAAIALGISIALSHIAGLRGRDMLRVCARFAVVGVILFAFHAWQHSWDRGFAVVGTLLALILAASALTATTTVEDTVDTVTRALRPLRRLGAKPEQVALAFSLVIRTIPTILGIAHDTRSAARARGLERSVRAYAVPLVLRTVVHAQLTGEALAARGLPDEEGPTSSRG